jgi:hypothetical protein
MWILPKQLHISAYAQDTKELGLDLEAFCQTCEKSLTWRGKDSVSRTWLQRWRRENWMQHLSSRMLKPSLTESFVDAWTSSLEDSRVSHSVLLESVKLLKTPDISSPTSQTESESANLELFSLKTYKESSPARQPTENPFSNMSSESWKEWVIEQRQEYSQRKKSAHLIRESESSSLGWPTARTSDAEGGRIDGDDGAGLQEQEAQEQPNLRSETAGCSRDSRGELGYSECRTTTVKGASKTSGDGLSTQVKQEKNWVSPTASQAEKPQGPNSQQKGLQSSGAQGCSGDSSKELGNSNSRRCSPSEATQKRLKRD